MMRRDFRSDFKCLQPLYIICKCLALLPRFDINDLSTCRPQYFFGILMILIYTATETFSIYGKIIHLGHILYPTVYLTLIATDFILLAGNIWAIFCGNLYRGKAVGVFLAHFNKIDAGFKNIDLKKNMFTFIGLNLELVVSHIGYCIYISLNLYIWNKLTGNWIHFIGRDFQNYQFMIFSLLTRYWALSLRYRFEILNNVLRQFKYNIRFCDSKTGNVRSVLNLKRISKAYTQLTWMVDEYNSILGFQFVLFYINVLFNLLLPINMALVYGNGEREVNGIRLGAELIALCVIWSSFPMILSTGMFSACGSGANEAAKTATICYEILHTLPSNDQFKQLRYDIIILAEQACNKAPTFTAAGFFTIDTSSLFALFGAVTSYLIVLIQFNK